MATPVHVSFSDQDHLIATPVVVGGKQSWSLKVRACKEVVDLLQLFKATHGQDILAWPLPTDASHSHLLLKELLLKIHNKWEEVYPHQELCHCRAVPTQVVDEAIVLGAHDIRTIRRQTSANTACGTCQPEVEKLLEQRLAAIKL